jgi:tetratricopeptide (TPR) repeat protein
VSAPAPATSAAAPPPAAAAPPTEAQRAAAREAYTRGQALFAQSKFADARVAFQEAYDAVPNPVVLFSLAECQLRLGNFEEAHATFTKYLADRPDAPERADVDRKLAEIAAMPATLVLTSAPAGAGIRIDGADTGKVTPADVELLRGEHTLELTLAGHSAISESVTAKAAVRHELHAELQPLPPPPPPVAVVPPPPPRPAPEPPTEAIWLTSIVGATGLVTGTVLGFMALAERSDYDANPTAESADRGERLALFADVAFGVGAISALTAIVLYATGDEPSEPAEPDAPESARSGSRWSLAPVVAPGHLGLASEGRF